MAAAASDPVLGWTAGCSTRGTFDIIWSCVQTILLCSWVSVCTNLPAPKGGKWDITRDKVFFTLLTLYGPELVFLLAFGQYHSARASVREFEKLGYKKDDAQGYEGWTLIHGFYADMGGIHVQPRHVDTKRVEIDSDECKSDGPESDGTESYGADRDETKREHEKTNYDPNPDFPSFPVNTRQLAWLIRNDFLEMPDDPKALDSIRQITSENILARSKSDILAKSITIMQALNFLVTTIARLATGLAVTTFELTVVANIFCTFATSIVWWHKPMDVTLGHPPLRLNASMTQILKYSGSEFREYYDTPLDFIGREDSQWFANLMWHYYVNILRSLKLLTMFSLHEERPSQRISPFNFRGLALKAEVVVFTVGMLYCAWFLGAWNFYFPSIYETKIWRAASIAQPCLCIIAPVFEKLCEERKPLEGKESAASTSITSSPNFSNPDANPISRPADLEHASRTTPVREARKSLNSRHLLELWNRPCSNEKGDYPSRSIPLRTLLVTTPLCAGYVICRWIIWSEDIISLRLLPSSAYQTVDWTPYWPWF